MLFVFDLLFEEDFKVFAKPRRVVIARRFGVAERLEQRISLQDLLSDRVARRSIDLSSSQSSEDIQLISKPVELNLRPLGIA